MQAPLRRTKILATLGPATDAPGVLDELIRAGVNVVRMNFSHGTPEQQRQWLEPLLDGRIRSAFSMSEPSGRSNHSMWVIPSPKPRAAIAASPMNG